MGIWHDTGGGVKDISSEIPAAMRADFNYYRKNLYTGDYDDFDYVIIKKFYAWYDAGAIRRQAPSSGPKSRLFVDVPFPKKDDFKRKYKGLWDSGRKCWYVLVSGSNHHSLRDEMIADGYKPILLMPEKQDRVDTVFDSGLAKKKFNDLHIGHSVVGSSDKVYTG